MLLLQSGVRDMRPGYVVGIATGAPLPPGADAVVQVEDTELLKATPDVSVIITINPKIFGTKIFSEAQITYLLSVLFSKFNLVKQ